MSAREYRLRALEVCAPNMGKLALVTFVFYLISGALGALSSIGVGAVAILLVEGPLTLGYVHVIVNNYKKEDFTCNTLFTGFGNFGKTFLVYLLKELYTFLWSLLFVIPGIIKSFAYSMSFYIHNDHPELTADECITRSKEMMKGHKWDLFCLYFSYIGWFILGALTLGIILFWVVPKVETATYLFYKDINGEAEPLKEETEE